MPRHRISRRSWRCSPGYSPGGHPHQLHRPVIGTHAGPDAWASAIGLPKLGRLTYWTWSSESAPKDDWAAQLTEKVGQLVELVRDHTVRPVQKFVRAAIFGALAFSVVIFVIVAFVIGFIRLLNNEVFDQRVWASYLLIGGIFVGVGTLISRMPTAGASRPARREATQMESGAIRDVVILGSGPLA